MTSSSAGVPVAQPRAPPELGLVEEAVTDPPACEILVDDTPVDEDDVVSGSSTVLFPQPKRRKFEHTLPADWEICWSESWVGTPLFLHRETASLSWL